MIPQSDLIQIHYELAMSIGTSLDLNKMLRKSLTTILRKLNCPAGGVHFFIKRDDDNYQLEEIITIPRDTSYLQGYQEALRHITSNLSFQAPSCQPMRPPSCQPYTPLTDFSKTLPFSGTTEDGTFTIMELPGLGVLILLKNDALDSQLLKSFGPIATKLAVACNACLQNEEHIHHQENLQKTVAEKTAELVSKNQQLTQEIEHRERYEEALRESEEKYRELVQNANSIILRWDTDGRVIFFNEYAQTFFGFREEEIIGRHVVGTIVPQNDSLGQNLEPLMDNICNNPQKYEYNVNENIRKDGSIVWVAWTNRLLTDENGTPIGALSIGADITKQKIIEEKLAERERSLAEAQKIAHLGNWSWNITTNTLDWSDEIYRIFGVVPQEFEATYESFMNFIHPVDREIVQEAIEKALYNNEPYNVIHRIILNSGEERVVHEHGRVSHDKFNKPTRIVGVVQDITERNKSELRFKMAAEAMSDLIYEWDMQDDTLQWFGDIDSALGFEQGAFPHTLQAWSERIHPNDIAMLADAVAHHRSSTDPISYEYKIQRADGSWVFWSDYGVPILNSDGKPCRWIGACTDITEKKKAEQQLIESEERYRALFTNEIDAISIFEIDTKKIVDVNDAWLKLYGYQRDEFERLTVEDVSAEPEVTKEAVKLSTKIGSTFIPERYHRKKDGTKFVVELSAGPFVWKGKNLMYALVRDITERKRMEDELRASEHQVRLITDNSPAYIAYVGANDMRYRFVNKKFEESFNRPREEIVGKRVKDIIGEENYEFALPHIEKVLSGNPVSYENEFPVTEGNRWIQVNYVPDFDEYGSVQGVVVLSHDITDLKNTQDKYRISEELLAETQKIAQLGSWEFDMATEEIKWSKETFRISGRKPKEKLTLQEYLNFIHPEDLPSLHEALGKATAEKKHMK